MADLATIPYDRDMQTDPLFFFRIVSGFGLVVTIIGAIFVIKNSGRLFGVDADVPSETAGARAYGQLLVYGVLAHAVIFCGLGLAFL